jgi:hypothetical protein
MRLIMPKWLVVLEIMLLVAGLTVLGYKAATRILPFPVEAMRQKRITQKPPAQPTIVDYYRKYPDRYIRIENESWLLDPKTHAAIHKFTLRNLAIVAYADIVVRITYEGAGSKIILTHDIKIQGALQGQSVREFKNVNVNGIPESTRNAVATIAKARIVE